MADVVKIPADALLERLGPNGERWAQNRWLGDRGDGVYEVCLHGAIRACAPQPGDDSIVTAIACLQGWGPSWQDDELREWDEVRDRIDTGIVVTDAVLEQVFGPRWSEIVDLVREASRLTEDDLEIAFEIHARLGTTEPERLEHLEALSRSSSSWTREADWPSAGHARAASVAVSQAFDAYAAQGPDWIRGGRCGPVHPGRTVPAEALAVWRAKAIAASTFLSEAEAAELSAPWLAFVARRSS